MQTHEVKLHERWVKFARSARSLVVNALTCFALGFAPVFLFVLGKEGASFTDLRVILSWASIVLFPLVYIRLAAQILQQLRIDRDSERPA